MAFIPLFSGISSFSPINDVTSATMQFWIDPTGLSTVTKDGSDGIEVVEDLSGNGLDLTYNAGLSSAKALHDADGAIQFDGTNSWNDAGGTGAADSDKFNFLHNGTGGTVIMVVKFDSAIASGDGALFSTAGFVSSGQTGAVAWFRDSGAFEQQLAINIVQSAGQASQNNLSDFGLEINKYMILTLKMGKSQGGDDHEFRINNALYDTAEKNGAQAYSTADSNWSFLLGSSGSGTVGELRFKEVLVYEDYVSDADLIKIHSYLNSKHAVYPLPIKSHLLDGQSNAGGLAPIANATDFERGDISPRGLINSPDDDSGWVTLKAGDRSYSRGTTQFGPEVRSLQVLTENDTANTHGIIKYAQDSTSLAVDWASSGATWLDAKAETNQAIAEASTQLKRPSQIVGGLWVQGETDAQTLSFANNYATNLTNLISRFRTEITGASSTTPFLIVETYTDDAVTYPYVDEVNAGKAAAVEADDYLALMPNTGFGTIVSDDIHLNAASQESIGEVYASMFENPVNSVAPVVSGDTGIGDTLTATNGTWDRPIRAYTYQWQRDSVDISGETGTTYTTVEADDGTNIRCVVTAYTFDGSASANSNALSITAINRESSLSALIDNVVYDYAANISASYSGTGQTVSDISGSGNNLHLGTTSGTDSADPTFTGTANDAAAEFTFGSADLIHMASPPTSLLELHHWDQDFSIINTGSSPSSASALAYIWSTGLYGTSTGLVAIQEHWSSSVHSVRLLQVADNGTTFAATPFVATGISGGTDYALLVSVDVSANQVTFIVNDGAPSVQSITPVSPAPSTTGTGPVGYGAASGAASQTDAGMTSKTQCVTLDVITESEWDNTVLPQLNSRDGVTY